MVRFFTFPAMAFNVPLSATKLIRRFALHILPKGFMRVRQYRFLANAVRVKRLEAIKAALKVCHLQKTLRVPNNGQSQQKPYCQKCQNHRWHCIGTSQPRRWVLAEIN